MRPPTPTQRLGILFSMLSCILATHPAQANETFTSFGDHAANLLPLTAFGATYLYDDPEGRRQYLWQVGTSIAVVHLGKQTVGKLRPSEANEISYPSGHTSAAFSGAAFLNTRYGPSWGVPAYGVAGLVGLSRVTSDNHFMDDVFAGASISLFSNWLFVTPMVGPVSVQPTLTSDGTPAVSVSLFNEDKRDLEDEQFDLSFEPKYIYTWDFGPVWHDHNRIVLPKAGLGPFDLTEIGDLDDVTWASRVFFHWASANPHIIELEVAPFETRNAFVAPVDLDLGDISVKSGERVRMSYRLYEYRATYYYNLAQANEDFLFGVGGGLTMIDKAFTFGNDQQGFVGEGPIYSFVPTVSAKGRMALYEMIGLFGEVNWGQGSNDKIFDFNLGIDVKLATQWLVSLGYRLVDRELEKGDLINDMKQNQVFGSFSYLW
ncbi:MAG: phosphatase PAP2 family protein [Verrucomicrobia bacterium]|nr:phosphatase PAP2 family protein [Verrucomicrobiota bacterium]